MEEGIKSNPKANSNDIENPPQSKPEPTKNNSISSNEVTSSRMMPDSVVFIKTLPPEVDNSTEPSERLVCLEVHPLASIFPLMSSRELKALVDDIRDQGLVEPILRFEGKIVDGRHRCWACLVSSITPRFFDWEGNMDSLLNHLFSRNLYRRHLSESQRSMLAAKLELVHGDDMKKTIPNGIDSEVGGKFATGDKKGKFRDNAANLLNVSSRLVGYAQEVLKRGEDIPALVGAVESGEIKVSAAATIAKLSADEIKQVLALDKVERRKKLNAIRLNAATDPNESRQQTEGGEIVNDGVPQPFAMNDFVANLNEVKKTLRGGSHRILQLVNDTTPWDKAEKEIRHELAVLIQVLDRLQYQQGKEKTAN